MNFYITVNNREIEAIKGETILQALKRAGISVPTLCNMNGFTPTGACRICMVEVTGKSDLVPACSYPVEEWMEIQTHTPRVIKARKVIVELLLSGHPDDCLYCERNCHCELQNLAYELNIRERKHSGKRINRVKDLSSPAIIRDPAKCILCGRCVRVCEEIIACSTLEFSGKGNISGITTTCNRSMNNSSCITCGQCIMVCPTSALYEKKHMAELQIALGNKELLPIAVVDPVVSVTLADINGNRNLRQAARQLNAVLKKCGFGMIYDYSVFHDLYVRKVAQQIVAGKAGTLLSSNCPAWIKFAEQQLQELLGDISTIKSPSQLAGSFIKSIHESNDKIKPDQKKPFVVSISPCTARKFEAQRKEFSTVKASDVDLVITTRTLEQIITLNGLDLNQVETEEYDKPFNTSSLHGELGGIAGGTMEAVAATVYHSLSDGKDLHDPKMIKSRFGKSIRETEFTINRKKYRFAAVSGMAEAVKFLNEAKKKPGTWCFIEVMACPAGCVNGGGQPISGDAQIYRQRQKLLVDMADKNALTTAYRNRSIDDLLASYDINNDTTLEQLLTTEYKPRNII